MTQLTNALDQQILARQQLQHRKQTLENEIHFLNQIHSCAVEECQQTRALTSARVDCHQLTDAIGNIRNEYEQLNRQQQHQLRSWYRTKVSDAVRTRKK
jgi:hypothetical protein